jgi:hypothetical protein
MTVRKRSLLIGSLCVFALVLYGAAKYYSPSLVRYVVEQSLLQKAPSGANAASLHERFNALLSATPDSNSHMERLLRISEYLEKVQRLNFEELDQLLAIDRLEKSGIWPPSSGFSDGTKSTIGEHPAL